MIMTMIGTAATPLMTALQNNALIGSTGVKLSTAPITYHPAANRIDGASEAGAITPGGRGGGRQKSMASFNDPIVASARAASPLAESSGAPQRQTAIGSCGNFFLRRRTAKRIGATL